jgi:hypothetical protein
MLVELCAHLEQFFFSEEALKERELRPLPKAFEYFMDPRAPFVIWNIVGDNVQAALPAPSTGDPACFMPLSPSAR